MVFAIVWLKLINYFTIYRKLKGLALYKYYRLSPSLIGLCLLLAMFVEIAGFIIVGKAIGVFATLVLIILSMVLGSTLLRIEGLSLLNNVQAELRAGRSPTKELANGFIRLIAAILLIIPGFVSDVIALGLFMPFIRDKIWGLIVLRYQTRCSEKPSQFDDDKVINLNPDDYKRSNAKDSPLRSDNDHHLLP